jgi:hypothetical protein
VSYSSPIGNNANNLSFNNPSAKICLFEKSSVNFQGVVKSVYLLAIKTCTILRFGKYIMEIIDYHKVLGLKKFCSKKEIVQG